MTPLSPDEVRSNIQTSPEHQNYGRPSANYTPRSDFFSKESNHGKKDLSKKNINATYELAITWCGIVITLAATSLLTWDMVGLMQRNLLSAHYGTFLIQGLFLTIFFWMIYGNILYQFCRLGYIARLKKHQRASYSELNKILLSNHAPEVTCLIVIPISESIMEVP